MVLLGNQCVPSACPTGNAHWNDNNEGFGALFGGRRGAITSVNASSCGWTVVFDRKVGGILWTRRLKLCPCPAPVAETIRIHPFEGDGWIRMVSRWLDELPWRTEGLKGCQCKTIAGGYMPLHSPSWSVCRQKMVVGVVQNTKWKLRTRSFVWSILSILIPMLY